MASQSDREFLVRSAIISPDVDDPSWWNHTYECVAEWELEGEGEEGGGGTSDQA